MKTVVKFKHFKDTKGTIRYEEEPTAGTPPVVGSLYVKRYALSDPPPETLTVTIEA